MKMENSFTTKTNKRDMKHKSSKFGRVTKQRKLHYSKGTRKDAS